MSKLWLSLGRRRARLCTLSSLGDTYPDAFTAGIFGTLRSVVEDWPSLSGSGAIAMPFSRDGFSVLRGALT